MLGELGAGEILRLRLDLDVAPAEMPRHKIVDGIVPHHVAMPAKLARLEAGGAELGKIGQFPVEQLRIEAFP